MRALANRPDSAHRRWAGPPVANRRRDRARFQPGHALASASRVSGKSNTEKREAVANEWSSLSLFLRRSLRAAETSLAQKWQSRSFKQIDTFK